MTARQHVVRTHRRPRRNTTGVTAWALISRLEERALAAWPRWAGHYGALLGPWLPQVLRSPSRRLELLVTVVLATALDEIAQEAGASWSIDLETDEAGAPKRLIVSGAGSAISTPIRMTERMVSVDGYDVALRSRDCGARLLERLLDCIASALADPARAA